jgi:polysaccharide export outer membrane protein
MSYPERDNGARARARLGPAFLPLTYVLLAGCSALGSSGPNSMQVSAARKETIAGAPIEIVDMTEDVVRNVLAVHAPGAFSQTLGDAPPNPNIIGPGDVLQVTIWEAPPAALFGANTSFGGGGDPFAASAGLVQRSGLPEMTVDARGRITVPFAGAVPAAGRTTQEVEREIVTRLAGKAHEPQVSVRVTENASSTVAVVGDDGKATRVPLTPRGERLLDIITSAGGVTKPAGKVMIEVTRAGRVAYMPLESIIRNPAENIRLGPNDVVQAVYQPFSFIALGATSTSAEIPFEATGLTLSQALGRVGGLKDDRANVKGAYIFRFEDPAALDPAVAATAHRTPDGRIPVIYRIDLRKATTLFAAQRFPMRDKDVLYVSSAPLTDLQRFVGILSSLAFTLIGLGQAVP